MFPIRDHNPSGRVPYVTYALILLNVGIFCWYWLAFPHEVQLITFYWEWGLVPRRVMAGTAYGTVLTSMFLHEGVLHLAGNMLFLYIFGDNLEDVLGHLRYLGLYVLSGLAAALFQIYADPSSAQPMIGASGAIAGVMGGYLLLFPRAKIDILFIFVIFFRVIPIPAWVILAIWFGVQLFSGLYYTADGGGVAYWAHAGGFIAGFVLMIPIWFGLGGPRFWRATQGQPPHPETNYTTVASGLPRVRRRK